METLELFQRFSVALAIGLLIGLERGWQTRTEPAGGRTAGLRTHALGALLGAVWGAIALSRGGEGLLALSIAFAVFSGAIGLFRYRETVVEGSFGVTTVVATMLTFALGAMSVVGNMQVAGAAGVAVAGLLAAKATLHGWVRRLSWIELRSGLLLLAMTFILLPLLPRRAIDPWGAINPFELWLMTVLIAAISFAGYVAIKVLGERGGIAVTAIAGGLASSTAVTLTMARLAAEHPNQKSSLAGGAMLSSATMMVRVIAVVALANIALLPRTVLPLGIAALVLGTGGLLALRSREPTASNGRTLGLTNPFELTSVLKFGALLTLITILARVTTGIAGNSGTYALAAFSGIADVDAITLSMARLGGGALSVEVAARAILTAVGVNTIAKMVLAWTTGGRAFGGRIAAVSGAALAAGLLASTFGPVL